MSGTFWGVGTPVLDPVEESGPGEYTFEFPISWEWVVGLLLQGLLYLLQQLPTLSSKIMNDFSLPCLGKGAGSNV